MGGSAGKFRWCVVFSFLARHRFAVKHGMDRNRIDPIAHPQVSSCRYRVSFGLIVSWVFFGCVGVNRFYPLRLTGAILIPMMAIPDIGDRPGECENIVP